MKEKERWGIRETLTFHDVFKIRLLGKKPPYEEYFIGYDSDDGMFTINHSEYSYNLNKILKIQGLLNNSGEGILISPLNWTREEIEHHIPWKIPEENWMLTFPTYEKFSCI